MRDTILRIRAIVDEYFLPVILCFAVVLLVGGFLTYSAYGQSHEKTETSTRTEITWTSAGEFTHQAEVTESTNVYYRGQTLENRPAYFQQISPVLEGEFSYGYSANDGSLTTDVTLTRVSRSTISRGDEEAELWRTEDHLGRRSRTLSPNQQIRLSFSQNVTEIQQEIGEIESQLGVSGGQTETYILASVDIQGTRNGKNVDDNSTYKLSISSDGGLYRVNDSSPFTETNEETIKEQKTVTEPPGLGVKIGGPGMLLVGFFGLFELLLARKDDEIELSGFERACLDYQEDVSEFDEWITEANFSTIPIEEADTHITVNTLSGLVDLAIDNDRRVLEAADDGRYFVLDDSVVYSYDPPTWVEPYDSLAEVFDRSSKYSDDVESKSQNHESEDTDEE